MDRRILSLSIVAVLAGVLFLAALEGYFTKSANEIPLPDIAGEFFTTVVVDDGPESQRLLDLFATNPILNKIQQRERHNQLSSTDDYYLENFKPKLKEGNKFPLFIVQRPNGDSCLILSRDTMPDSSEELVSHLRRRCHPGPDKPGPIKKIADKVKEKALIVDTIKKVATGGNDGSMIAFIISALLSGGYGLKQVFNSFNPNSL